MRNYPKIIITAEMINQAKEMISSTRVNRTVASPFDTLTGHLGEYIFAEYFYGNWRLNNVGKNKGKSDFDNIEVKASAFPFSERLNLLVRQDYALKRKPKCYVQIILSIKDRFQKDIYPDTFAYIGGFATADEVDKAPLRDWGSKFGKYGGYKCHYIMIKDLKPISEIKKYL